MLHLCIFCLFPHQDGEHNIQAEYKQCFNARVNCMNRIKNGVVTNWDSVVKHEKTMWIHHWFITRYITCEQRTTLTDAPTFEKVKHKPRMLGEVDGFKFKDFVQRVASGPDGPRLKKMIVTSNVAMCGNGSVVPLHLLK